MTGFVERHGLRCAARQAAAREASRRIESGEFDVLRLSFADLHGVLRGKAVTAAAAPAALRDGVSITSTLFAKDTSHRTVLPVFAAGGGSVDMPELQGAADVVMVPDAATLRTLPWAPRTGWMLCDTYLGAGPRAGQPVPFDTRHVLRRTLARLDEAGFALRAGLEVEFHLFRLEDARLRPEHAGQPGEPPAVALLTHGYQYLSEQRLDQLDPMLDILRRDLVALGLPLRTLEVEFGPSQVELTFDAQRGLEPADTMVLLRSAVKQICRRHGHHATFMCRPRIPNVMSSGWHLHQSLDRTSDGANAFIPSDGAPPDAAPLSETGTRWLAGLLAHARGASALSTPTVNGFRRYRPFSLAPDRAIWGRDNRGAMLRVVGGANDATTRIENRIGEPAANPYLYLASQVLAGLDGLARALQAGPSADSPYEADAPLLPRSLPEALAALRADDCLRDGLTPALVDWFCRIKEAEWARFVSEVSDWEQREYFDAF